ncbi:hypothetical protein I4U23_005708 [Adineta vaga]|nr:hypothetical protein I4U23_005708 [Adineta vaga]
MNTTVSNPLSYLFHVEQLISRYLLIMIVVIGTFSNLATIIIFRQKHLRSTSCSWYFMSMALCHLLYIDLGCLSRAIAAWAGFHPSLVSSALCKLWSYLTGYLLILSRHFLCLIAIDRWMVTSRNIKLRRCSSRKIAQWLIIIGSIFWALFNIHLLIKFRIEIGDGCSASDDSSYLLFYIILNLCITFVPLTIIIVFSCLLMVNIQTIGRAQALSQTDTSCSVPQNSIQNSHHRINVQFIRLSLIQIGMYIICNLLHVHNVIYAYVSLHTNTSVERKTITIFLNIMGVNLNYLYTSVRNFILFHFF